MLSAYGNTANYIASQRDGNVQEINADWATLPAWWDANNPTRQGQLLVADVYTPFASAAKPDDLIQGAKTGAFDDLHPSALGNVLHGYIMADALMAAIS